MTVAEVFTDYVAPAIGNVLAVILLLSPTPAVLRAKRIQHLEHLNVLPYPGTLCVCTAIVGYGLVLHEDYMVQFLLGAMLFFCVFSTIGVFALGYNAQKQMWGISTVVLLMAYYALPLSSLGTVIKTRNSASIYMPLAVCAVLNGTTWAVYGWLGLNKLFVWLPNLVGAVLGAVQVLLRLVIPAKPYQHTTSAADPEAVCVHTNGAYEEKPHTDDSAPRAQTRVRVLVRPEDST